MPDDLITGIPWWKRVKDSLMAQKPLQEAAAQGSASTVPTTSGDISGVRKAAEEAGRRMEEEKARKARTELIMRGVR